MNRLVTLLISFCVALQLPSAAQAPIPAVIPGDFADPSIISDGKNYFAVGTSSEWAPHFPIYQSADMKQWKQVGYVFDKAPEWTVGSFWAPEYYYMNGQYFIYYTARRKKDNISCIGVAVSTYPDRGFVDKGVIIEYGKEAIDAYIFDDNGQRYISFKAFGLDQRPIELLATKLSADGLRTEGVTFSLLKDDTRVGLEGQSFIKKGDYYYLFYSAGNCCGAGCDYNVQVARSKQFAGPYERFEQNPILSENADWKCSGHGTFVQDKNGQDYFLYHAYSKQSNVFTGRQGLLAALNWPNGNDWPVFAATVSSGVTIAGSLKDDFRAAQPGLYWQWDWRNSSPSVKQGKGQLRLGGTVNAKNATGIVLTTRPFKAAFEVATRVSGQSSALRGLAYYGDVNASIGFGIADQQLQVWKVQSDQFRVVQTLDLPKPGAVELKISVDAAHQCRFYYKQSGDWKELVVKEGLSVDFLPQWDRSPRPGLHFKGSADQSAAFTNFSLEYR